MLGLLGLYLLVGSNKKIWLLSGFFIALLWFWWILLSFRSYGMVWAIPVGTLMVAATYGFIFWLMALIADKLTKHTGVPVAIFHSIWLLLFSFIHPFGFDWFKPELIFIDSYIGIAKWQFAIVLGAVAIFKITKKPIFLLLIIFAYQAVQANAAEQTPINNIKLVTTNISVDMKWVESNQKSIAKLVFYEIDKAIKDKKEIIIFPESVFPLFLNLEPELLTKLQTKAKKIDMVIGALYWDENIPRNSTYVFANDKITVINKVVLVPFGEANPLPAWMGKMINRIFFKEGVLDYVASDVIGDYKLKSKTIRNAICYEATSEKLYKDDPRYMIAISNNGWFYPSIEPTLQQLLLKYYSLKYGTTIYHSINMSPSYVVQNGKVFYAKQ